MDNFTYNVLKLLLNSICKVNRNGQIITVRVMNYSPFSAYHFSTLDDAQVMLKNTPVDNAKDDYRGYGLMIISEETLDNLRNYVKVANK